MVGDYTSTSFATGPTHDLGLTVFAVGLPVAGKTCTLGSPGSGNEPMEAPSAGLVDVPSPARAASSAGVVSRGSDHRAPTRPLVER